VIDTVQFGRQVLMIQSSLLHLSFTINTQTVTFITNIHHNRSSPFNDALDWSWQSIPNTFHRLWAGWQRALFLAGARKL